MIMNTSKSNICKVGWQAGNLGDLMLESEGCLLQNQENLMLQMKSKDSLLENSLLLKGGWSYYSVEGLNRLDEGHAHYRGQSALLKVH